MNLMNLRFDPKELMDRIKAKGGIRVSKARGLTKQELRRNEAMRFRRAKQAT